MLNDRHLPLAMWAPVGDEHDHRWASVGADGQRGAGLVGAREAGQHHADGGVVGAVGELRKWVSGDGNGAGRRRVTGAVTGIARALVTVAARGDGHHQGDEHNGHNDGDGEEWGATPFGSPPAGDRRG
jgi:hypothetical protein